MATDRRVVVISGLVLAALLAGLLWYQLIRQPSEEVPPSEQEVAFLPSPSPFAEPVVIPSPSPEPDLTLVPPAIGKGGLEIEVEDEPLPVEPTAPTGPVFGAPMWLALLPLGLLGLIKVWRTRTA